MRDQEIRVLNIERVDDIPLLLAQLERMQVAKLLDQHFPTHGNWAGALSFGEVAEVWLSFILSQADHRLNQVEPWAAEHLQTLAACLGKPVRALDFSDDRLAAMLESLAATQGWCEFERGLNHHLLRVYDLHPKCVRLDTTTGPTYAGASPDGLFQFGQSKNQRADLAQVKIALASLDPLGLPLVTQVVSGNCADDPLYVPQIKQVQEYCGHTGKLYVGDAKMGALQTRAYVASSGEYYLCPLRGAQLQALSLAELLKPVWSGTQALSEVRDAAGREVLALGFETRQHLRAQVAGRWVEWSERRLVVRSLKHAAAETAQLEKRLQAAQAQFERLQQRKRGKKRLTAQQLQAACERIIQQHEVRGLIHYAVRPEEAQAGGTTQAAQTGQAFLEWWLETASIERAKELLGWRIYATNLPTRDWSLEQVVLAYREQYLIEHGFGRLKGCPLGLVPFYLQAEERVQGLIHLLTIGLRLLCLVEWVVAQALPRVEEAEEPVLRGLYAGQAGRASVRPSTELLLRAFRGLTLLVQEVGGQVWAWLTPLSKLQARILKLLGFSTEVYERVVQHCLKLVPL